MKKKIIDELNRIYSGNSCLFISQKLFRVKCPFKVLVLKDIDCMKMGDLVSVSEVKMSYNLRIIYKIEGKYYYHSTFELIHE